MNDYKDMLEDALMEMVDIIEANSEDSALKRDMSMLLQDYCQRVLGCKVLYNKDAHS